MNFVQRDEAVQALSLAYHSGEHILLLGPPGTAKTLLAETFSRWRIVRCTRSPSRSTRSPIGPIW